MADNEHMEDDIPTPAEAAAQVIDRAIYDAAKQVIADHGGDALRAVAAMTDEKQAEGDWWGVLAGHKLATAILILRASGSDLDATSDWDMGGASNEAPSWLHFACFQTTQFASIEDFSVLH